MNNLINPCRIPCEISGNNFVKNLENLAAQQTSVAKMAALYRIAAHYVESKVSAAEQGWIIKLFMSRSNYLQVVEEFAKLEKS